MTLRPQVVAYHLEVRRRRRWLLLTSTKNTIHGWPKVECAEMVRCTSSMHIIDALTCEFDSSHNSSDYNTM